MKLLKIKISWREIRTYMILVIIGLVYIICVPNATPGMNSLEDRVLGKAHNVLFDYVKWEADALSGKVVQSQAGIAPYMTEPERSKYVRDYLNNVGTQQTLNGQISRIYSNPTITDPDSASADLRKQRDAINTLIADQQPLAEAIMESQVESVLRDEGFAILGQVMPPLSAHITALPMLLVISPRDQIRFELGISTISMSADQQDALENSIDHALNVSSLVVPLGGLSLYPSMIQQTWYTPFAFNTVAHEWTHHYLYFFALGQQYGNSAETRIINETTASLLGAEVSRKVIEKFYQAYPDIIAQLPPPIAPTPSPTPAPAQQTPTPTPTLHGDPDERPVFNYSAEMNETRITVDFYLHFGMVDLAEKYMQGQRYLFAAHGYPDKINQAYFAFYGGYQVQGVGISAGGTDPTGSAIVEIRQRSPSLKAWLETMRNITTRDQLLAVRDSLRNMP